MDNFYASVVRRYRLKIHNNPIVIGGDEQ